MNEGIQGIEISTVMQAEYTPHRAGMCFCQRTLSQVFQDRAIGCLQFCVIL